jgi:hypothetical protein
VAFGTKPTPELTKPDAVTENPAREFDPPDRVATPLTVMGPVTLSVGSVVTGLENPDIR